MVEVGKLEDLAKLIRYFILKMTTEAGSGHPTSSLSAVELMTALFFGKLRFDLKNPEDPNNDRVIFSKGHASPLIYALYAVAGEISKKELLTYRKFGSVLEGHPTPRFKFAEAATGSLGQGLSIGVGEALALRAGPAARFPRPTSSLQSNLEIKKNTLSDAAGARRGTPTRGIRVGDSESSPLVYVLMGDSEAAEGSVWEACELASYYKLGNLVAIIDVNRLGQSGETMLGWDIDVYRARFEAFGWEAVTIDGHNFGEILETYEKIDGSGDKPFAIIAKTIKGKGVSFLEDKEGWHGKALSRDEFEKAAKELGEIDKSVRGEVKNPDKTGPVSSFLPASAPLTSFEVNVNKNGGKFTSSDNEKRVAGNPSTTATRLPAYKIGEEIATRKAFGETLVRLGEEDERIVSLDAEVKNSTFAEIFKDKFPERFFECFIAEQNMVGMALGMSKRGRIPFVSTFATFLTRAFDQIRMSAISSANIKFVGSHSGVSIGEDGPSQMGLEDISLFKSVFGSVVLCPSDAVSCAKLVEVASKGEGIFYIRTARPATPVIYKGEEGFKIGGSQVLRSSDQDKLTIVSCGVTVHEAVSAYDQLVKEGIKVGVVDCYSIKPIDERTLRDRAERSNKIILTVEDHYFDGGLGDSVLNVFANSSSHLGGERSSHLGGVSVVKLAVSKMPMSGRGSELLDYEGISAKAIVEKVKEIVR